jgi:hypothetical protein
VAAVAAAFTLCTAAACSGAGGAHGGRSTRVIADLPDLSVPPPGDPVGHSTAARKAVFLFSQIGSDQQDPQVLQFSDAVLMRAWQKWDRWGLQSADYDFGYPTAAHAKGITFVAGGTASVVFPDEDPTRFEDWATRDAQGNLVEHAYIVPGAHRASLANPSYRAYLVDWCKKQIDGGVDGLFLDEANAGYTGGTRWGWNGNEGYDDWFLAAFDAWLLAQHPTWTADDFIAKYGMSADNAVEPGAPPGDLGKNFEYRWYLQSHGWDRDPASPANPLAPVFGPVTANRLDPAGTTFRDQALLWYWRDIVTQLRAYGRAQGKEIVITSNGLFPFVDFNGFGLYEGNRDDDGQEAVWVPVKGGHLDGAHSQQALYRKIRARSQAISGNVPLVLFMDWPTQTIDRYYAFSAQEKMDFWRIFGAEAYANGLFFAFHLRTTMPKEPTATDSGVLEFLKSYAGFYRSNAAVYLDAAPVDVAATSAAANVAVSVSSGGGKTYVHLVNHNYAGGLVPQTSFVVTLPLAAAPAAITLRTPDPAGEHALTGTWSAGTLRITVDRLESYDVIAIE